jgi:hypothetical protein
MRWIERINLVFFALDILWNVITYFSLDIWNFVMIGDLFLTYEFLKYILKS